MSNLRKIEQLTGGKALLEKRPADNYFPAEHWFLQTANGGTFASMSRQEVLCVALDVISEEAAEQSVQADGAEAAANGLVYKIEWVDADTIRLTPRR